MTRAPLGMDAASAARTRLPRAAIKSNKWLATCCMHTIGKIPQINRAKHSSNVATKKLETYFSKTRACDGMPSMAICSFSTIEIFSGSSAPSADQLGAPRWSPSATCSARVCVLCVCRSPRWSPKSEAADLLSPLSITFTFVVVTNNSNSRLLLRPNPNPNDRPTKQNVAPGKCLCTEVNRPRFTEFILESRCCIQVSVLKTPLEISRISC